MRRIGWGLIMWLWLCAGTAWAAVDVKSFGAKGDGRTDDTAPIQRAFDAVQKAGGGSLVVPAGRYRLTAPLRLLGQHAPLVIRGEGWSSRIINENTMGQPALVIGRHDWDGDDQQGNAYLTLADLAIIGNPRSGDGIQLLNVREVTLSNNLITANGGSGVYAFRCWASYYLGNRILRNGHHGLDLDRDANAVAVDRCQILGQGEHAGIRIMGSDGPTISSCDIEGNRVGILLENKRASNNLRVIGNHFEKNAIALEARNDLLGANLYGLTIIGNLFYQNSVVVGTAPLGREVSGGCFMSNFLNGSELSLAGGTRVKNFVVEGNTVAGFMPDGRTRRSTRNSLKLPTYANRTDGELPAHALMPRYDAPPDLPWGARDTKGATGDLRWDEHHLYLKTNEGWRYAPLGALSAYPSPNTFFERASAPPAWGELGDMVWNETPRPGGALGWVYTTSGWRAFGAISP